MSLRQRRHALIPVLLGLALLLPRASGAHLHVCLDGQETAVAMHAPDGGEHHGDEDEGAHQDRDVELGDNSSLGKAGKTLDNAAPAILGARVQIALASDPSALPPVIAAPIRRARFLQPPLRGPPA